MDNESFLTFDKILDTLDYDPAKDSNSKRTKSIKHDLKKRVDKIRLSPLALQAEGVKIIIRSNIKDIYTRRGILLGLKLCGHTDTLTEASNLIDELYKQGKIQIKQQNRNAINKIST